MMTATVPPDVLSVAPALSPYMSILAIPLPRFREMIRSMPRYERSARVRRLLITVGLDGARVHSYADNNCTTVLLPLPAEAIPALSKRVVAHYRGRPLGPCPVWEAYKSACLHVVEMIYAAYPDLEDRGCDVDLVTVC